MEDAKCPCGYVFSAEEPDTLVVEKKKKNKNFPGKDMHCFVLSSPGTFISRCLSDIRERQADYMEFQFHLHQTLLLFSHLTAILRASNCL